MWKIESEIGSTDKAQLGAIVDSGGKMFYFHRYPALSKPSTEIAINKGVPMTPNHLPAQGPLDQSTSVIGTTYTCDNDCLH